MRKELIELVNEMSQLAATMGSKQTNTEIMQISKDILNSIKSLNTVEPLHLKEEMSKGKKIYTLLTETEKGKVWSEEDDLVIKEEKEEEPKINPELEIFRKQTILYTIAALAGVEDIDTMLEDKPTPEILMQNFKALQKFIEDNKTINKRFTAFSTLLDENEEYITGTIQPKQKMEDDDPETRPGRKIRFESQPTVTEFDPDQALFDPNQNKMQSPEPAHPHSILKSEDTQLKEQRLRTQANRIEEQSANINTITKEEKKRLRKENMLTKLERQEQKIDKLTKMQKQKPPESDLNPDGLDFYTAVEKGKLNITENEPTTKEKALTSAELKIIQSQKRRSRGTQSTFMGSTTDMIISMPIKPEEPSKDPSLSTPVETQNKPPETTKAEQPASANDSPKQNDEKSIFSQKKK